MCPFMDGDERGNDWGMGGVMGGEMEGRIGKEGCSRDVK